MKLTAVVTAVFPNMVPMISEKDPDVRIQTRVTDTIVLSVSGGNESVSGTFNLVAGVGQFQPGDIYDIEISKST